VGHVEVSRGMMGWAGTWQRNAPWGAGTHDPNLSCLISISTRIDSEG
jgi:hypothetical protein